MKNYILLILVLCSIESVFAQLAQRIMDINPGDESSAAFNDNSTIWFNNTLFFSADDGVHGDELWIYKDSEARLLKDINEGADGSEIQHMYLVNGILLFTAETSDLGTEWWTSDGTEAGTQVLLDIDSGDSDGVYASFFSPQKGFMLYNDELYFTGIDDGDFELWKTNGTASGTQLVKNIASFGSSFPNSFTTYNDELYFSCREGFWKTNGTENGTVLILDEDPEDVFGFEPDEIFATEDYVLMLQNNDLWTSNGTTSGTIKISDFESTSLNWSGPRFRLLGDKVLFPADDGLIGDELWSTDGTSSGTQLVIDLWPGTDGYAPQNTVVFNNKLYYKGDDGVSDIELYVSDGTESGTSLFYEFSDFSSGFSLPTEIVADNEYIYMNSGSPFQKELWVTDGTNTFELSINQNGESRPNSFYLFDGKLFCFATAGGLGFEPYIIDLSVIDSDMDGYSEEEDCDDTNPNINPGQDEIPYNGLNDDCDVSTFDDDLDQDGFIFEDDCDDSNPDIYPGAEEIVNNDIDEDCDGVDLVSSTHEITNATISIYPNPAIDFINIEVIGQLDFKASLHDLEGKLMTSTANSNQLDVTAIPLGIYLLEIKDQQSGQKVLEKIIIGK